MRLASGLFACVFFAACGSRTGTLDDRFDAAPGPMPSEEECNGLDEDLDGSVDEDFRDDVGRYITDDHCGGCDARCVPLSPNELSVACTQRSDEHRHVSISLHPTEALHGLQDAGGDPPQHHLPAAPALDVALHVTRTTEQTLRSVGGRQKSGAAAQRGFA